MMNPGLTSSGMQRLKETMCMTHNVLVKVSLMDLNHNHIRNLTYELMEGQVNISSLNAITRSAQLTLWDPDFGIGIDAPSPSDGALFYKRMIRITYCVWRFGDPDSVDIPLFTGPIANASREGAVLSLNCLGKEHLARGAVWRVAKWKKGSNKANVIKALLQNYGGETRFDFSASTSKLGSNGLSLPKEAIIWDEAQKIAKSMRRQLFYDGRGTCRLRPTSGGSVVFAFRDGNGGSIVKPPTVDYTDEEQKNVLWVVGSKPRGSKKVASAVRTLPRTHPVNHIEMGRQVGSKTVPIHLLEKVSVPGITSRTVAGQSASARRDGYATQQVPLKAEVLAIPFLEESDLLSFEMQGKYITNYRMADISIPLKGAVGSVGGNKNLAIKRRK